MKHFIQNSLTFPLEHRRLLHVIACGILIVAAWTVRDLAPLTSIMFYILSLIIGGYHHAKETIANVLKEHEIDVNLLMILSAIGAGAIGHWSEGAILIFIFSLSGALEQYTTAKSSRDVEALMKLKPKQATKIVNGSEIMVDIEGLEVGDVIIVKPGETVAADGMVIQGFSTVNQSSITGESVPVDKTKGDGVFAGTLNGEGAILVEVKQTSEYSLFSKIIRLVQEAQNEMPTTQRFIERFEKWYAKIVIAATLLFIFVPPLFLLSDWKDSFYRAMVFMVVASPCALVASIMPAMLSAISNGARKGIIFKGGVHLEEMAGVKLVVFDKTGTLTTGTMQVSDIVGINKTNETDVLKVTAAIESLSQHPIARAIVMKAASIGIDMERPTNFQSVTGKGIEAEVNERKWKVGKPSFIETIYWSEESRHIVDIFQQQGKTVIVLQDEECIKGVIALQDTIKPSVMETIKRLKQQGIKVAMLTGDQQKTASFVAEETGIDLVYSDLMPDDKAAIVKELKQRYGKIAMVGDGVNDAPALATSNVGIAMGAVGSDAALETAQVVLMNDDIANIPYTIQLGRRMKKVVTQNLIFSISVITILVFINLIIGVPLPLGVVGHEGSTILVILNGLRLLKTIN